LGSSVELISGTRALALAFLHRWSAFVALYCADAVFVLQRTVSMQLHLPWLHAGDVQLQALVATLLTVFKGLCHADVTVAQLAGCVMKEWATLVMQDQ
jgi:hypothetical protein